MNHKNRTEEIRLYVKNKLSIADTISDYNIKFLIVFSLLESFAQEWKNYPKYGTSEAFCEFVMTFQRNYGYLDKVDPVTLYYDFEKELNPHFSLDYLSDGCCYYASSLVNEVKSEKIIGFLISNSITNQKRIEQHKYVKLLYKMRSKISHEHCHYLWSIVSSTWEECEPCFISCGNDWELGFPYPFIRNLAEECIDGFLKSREVEGLDPFKNNTDNRKFRLAWVDE